MKNTFKLSNAATYTSETPALITPITPPVIGAPIVHPLTSSTTTWTAGSGNFNTAADWSNGLPVLGVDAYINGTNTAPLTITYSSGSDTANSLTTTYTALDLSAGTLTLQYGSYLSSAAGAFSQTGGKIDFQNGESVNGTTTITGNGSAVQQTAGTIQVDQGDLDVEGNSSFAGTVTGLSGGGTLVLDSADRGATYTFTSTAHLTIGELVLDGGATTIDSGATVTVSEIVVNNNATLDVASNLTYAGYFDDISNGSNAFTLGGNTVTLTGSAYFAAINGNANIDGPGTLVLSAPTTTGSNYGNTVILAGSAKLTNTSTFTQNGNFQVGDGSGNFSGITNTSTGTWDIVAGNNLATGSDAGSSFANAGLFENTGSNTGPTIYTAFTNTGTISASASNSIYFDNSLVNNGTIAGAGQVAITGGSATLGTSSVLSVAELGLYNNASLTLGTNLAYAGFFDDYANGSTTLNLASATFSLTGTIELGAINGNAAIAGTGTLALSGATTSNSNYNNVVDIGGTATLANTGTFTQAGNVQIGDSSGGLASIINNKTWNSTSGYGIGTGIDASSRFENSGLFENTGSNAFPTISSVFTNAGTISIASGDGFAFNNTLSNTGTITGAGQLAITGGTATLGTGTVLSVASLDLAGGLLNIGTKLTYAGAFTDTDTNGGSLSLGSNAVSLTGSVALNAYNGSIDITGSGTLSLSGATSTASNFGNTVIVGGTETLSNSGSFTQGGNFQIGDASGALAKVVNSATGTWNISTANNIAVGTDVSSSFTNAGLFENTGSGNAPVVDALFNNTGTIEAVAASTSIILADGGSLGGTLSGAGTIDLAGGTFTVASKAAISVASLEIAGNGTSVTFGTTTKLGITFTQLGGSTIDLAGTATELGLTGASSLAGTVTGTGYVAVSSTSTSSVDGLTLAGAAKFEDYGGTVNQGGQVTVGNTSSSTAAILVSSGTYRITADVGISGSGSLTNAGTFEKYEGTNTSLIDVLVTNTGKLEANSGTLDFAANVTNNGTATAASGNTIEFAANLSSSTGDTGVIDLSDGGLASFGGYVSSSQTLSFLDSSIAKATISTPGEFAAAIKGFGGSNALFLSGLNNVSDTYSGTTTAGTLTLTEQENGDTVTVAQLHFAGDYALDNFSITNNPGGVLIDYTTPANFKTLTGSAESAIGAASSMVPHGAGHF
jgi:hypothetical protein